MSAAATTSSIATAVALLAAGVAARTHTPGGTPIPPPPVLPATIVPVSASTLSRISNVSLTNFGMPSGVSLPQLDGSNWNVWSSTLEAILTLFKCEDIINYDVIPICVTTDDWEVLQRRAKTYLHLYTKPDVYSLVASDADLPTFKHKWDILKCTYSAS
jgi:hypothetical protein